MPTPQAMRVELSEAERTELTARLRRRKVARGEAVRAEIVLLAADGMSNLAIAERLGITRVTVMTWRKRFAEQRLDGLLDEPRPGAPRTVSDEKVAEVVTATLETLPTGRTHWSSRGMHLPMTEPVFTSSAANSEGVPCRSGSIGRVRSSAWICDFSSTHSTSARSGGLR